jgi:general secretion pathway protein A
MYKDYYGLREMPFNITPDPNFLFLSNTHHDALNHLRYGIRERKGFMVLCGEAGCGKTTVYKTILRELDPHQYQTILILNPRLSETQLLKAILTELGVKKQPRSRADMMHLLNGLLLDLIQQGKDIVLICDESQNLDFETIEHLRMLSNLETDTRKLLQIILIGQPELKEKIKQRRLRQLAQRIQVFCELSSLNQEETCRYILHRLSRAGGQGIPSFTPRALRSIHRHSRGIPRIINNLCDKSLLSAYTRNRSMVNWWDVYRGLKEMNPS